MWVWPQLAFGGSPPPHPPLQLEDPSLKPKPSPPRPLPPSSPHPAWLFLRCSGSPGWGSPVWCGGRGPRGGGGGGPSSCTWGQTHIWGHSNIKDFSFLPNPQSKSPGKEGKNLEEARKSLKSKQARKPQKARKGRLPPPSKKLLTQKNSRGIIFGVIATVSRNQLRKKTL